VLAGGKGPDILIGGFGADRLTGGSGDDILIGGTTVYDRDSEALHAILTEWSRTGLSYSQRVNDLMNGGGLNGTFKLNEDTVFGGTANDILTGGSGQDWYFADVSRLGADRVTDWHPSEVVTHPAVQLAEKKSIRHFGEHGANPWIDWSHHFGDDHHTMHPCPSWMKDFVSDLATRNGENLNDNIQVILRPVSDSSTVTNGKSDSYGSSGSLALRLGSITHNDRKSHSS